MIAMLDTLKEENNKSEKKKRENKPNNKKGVLGWRQQHNNHYADGHQHQWLAILFFIRVGEGGAMPLKKIITTTWMKKKV
jgi:hypothetical protein